MKNQQSLLMLALTLAALNVVISIILMAAHIKIDVDSTLVQTVTWTVAIPVVLVSGLVKAWNKRKSSSSQIIEAENSNE